MTAIARDLRFSLRMLRKHPALTAIVVLTLALGIGLTGSMYGIVHGALRDLPFKDADRLYHLETNNLSKGIESMEVTLHDFLDWREQQTTFEGLAAFYGGTVNLAGDGGRPERYSGAYMTTNAFDLLRVAPLLGRTFRPGEDAPGAPPVAVIGHGLWQSRLGGDSGVIGRELRLNGRLVPVVGVMPEGFEFPIQHQVWLPLDLDPAEIERGEGPTLEVYGRLRDGVSADHAALEMATIAERLATAYPEVSEGVGSVIKPYTHEYVGREPRTLLKVMLGAVFGVLLIACVNVANLLLARGVERSREVAVRSALGATRRRVVAQLLTETLVLTTAGAVLGLGLAAAGIKMFSDAIAPTDPPFWIDVRLDPAVLAFVAGLTVVVSLVSGLVPALRATGGRVGEVLADESRGSSGLKVSRLSRGLVIAEVAVSCGLLVGAGLMVKSLVNLRTVDYPFSTDLFTARVGLFESDYPEEADRLRFYEDLERRLAELSGVRSAALTTTMPGLESWRVRLGLEGESYERDQDRPLARMQVVSAGYFDTLGVQPVEGRLLTGEDRDGGPPAVVVNRSFAASHFPGVSPLGRRLRLGDAGDADEEPWRTVVGVVPDLKMSGPEDEEPQGLYVPRTQYDVRFMSIVLATAGPPLGVTEAVREAVTSIDADLPIYYVQTLEQAILRANWFYGVFGTIFMVFGVVALALAAVGLYGVMAFAVHRRTHEMGIRMALGARAADVLRLILRQGAWQVAIGLTAGVGLAALLARGLEVLLFDVEPWDLSVFVGIAALLAATGALACLVPARRAARVDPSTALRHQ